MVYKHTHLYVTGFWRTDRIVTLGLFHFIGLHFDWLISMQLLKVAMLQDYYNHAIRINCMVMNSDSSTL